MVQEINVMGKIMKQTKWGISCVLSISNFGNQEPRNYIFPSNGNSEGAADRLRIERYRFEPSTGTLCCVLEQVRHSHSASLHPGV